MKNTLDIFRKGKDSRIAKHSAIPNDLDSTRSTLFGKLFLESRKMLRWLSGDKHGKTSSIGSGKNKKNVFSSVWHTMFYGLESIVFPYVDKMVFRQQIWEIRGLFFYRECEECIEEQNEMEWTTKD